MTEFFTEFATQLIIIAIIGTGGSVFGYFISLKKSFNKQKTETQIKFQAIEDRTIRFAKAFLHFVRRNDELHSNREGTPDVKLADEVETILRDEKGNL